MKEIEVGEVQDYFAHISVVAIRIVKGTLNVGDTVHFKGHTTDFTQTVDSMQIEHEQVTKAEIGDSVGIKVKDRVRHSDKVYKEKPHFLLFPYGFKFNPFPFDDLSAFYQPHYS